MAYQYEEDFDLTMTNNSMHLTEQNEYVTSTNPANNSLFELDPLSKQDTSMELSRINPEKSPVKNTNVNLAASEDTLLISNNEGIENVDSLGTDVSLKEDSHPTMPSDSLLLTQQHALNPTSPANTSLFELDPLSKHYLSMDVSGVDPKYVPENSSAKDSSSRSFKEETDSAGSSIASKSSDESNGSPMPSEPLALKEESEHLASTDTNPSDNFLLEPDPLSKHHQSTEASGTDLIQNPNNSPTEHPDSTSSGLVDSTSSSCNEEADLTCPSINDISVNKVDSSNELSSENPGMSPVKHNADSSLDIVTLCKASDVSDKIEQIISTDVPMSTSNMNPTQDLEIGSTACNQSDQASAKLLAVTVDNNVTNSSSEFSSNLNSGTGTASSSAIGHFEKDLEQSVLEHGESNVTATSDFSDIISCVNGHKEEVQLKSATSQNDLIMGLKSEIKNQQSELKVATSAEEALLQFNTELQEELKKILDEMSAKIELLEQERYSLQIKLGLKTQMEVDLMEEMDRLKLDLNNQKDKTNRIEAENMKTVTELKRELTNQQLELEQSQLCCQQLKNRCGELEQMLQEARQQINEKVGHQNETLSDELAQLHSEVNSLQNEKISLLHELNEARCKAEQYQHALEKTQHILQSKAEELEEKQCQSTSYYNLLQKAREEIQELKVQLDVAKMESQNRNSKGNSLFSEVEDRRVKAEKELISLKVKYESIKKELKIVKQHEFGLKTQLAIQIQKDVSKANLSHVERLQNELSCAHSEIASLHKQLGEMEKLPMEQDFQVLMKNSLQEVASSTYSDRLKCFEEIAKNKNVMYEDLKAKLDATRLHMVAESQRVMQHQREIFKYERELEMKENLILRLRLKLNEYQLKYNPDSCIASKPETKVVEKIPLVTKSGKENQPAEAKEGKNISSIEEKKQSVNVKSALESKYPLPGPILKRKQKAKTVTISDDVNVQDGDIQGCIQSSSVDSTQSETGTKCRLKGKQTLRNVVKVSYDEPQCKQQ